MSSTIRFQPSFSFLPPPPRKLGKSIHDNNDPLSKTDPQETDYSIGLFQASVQLPIHREISINLSLSLASDGAEKGGGGGFTTVSARTRNNDETSRPRSHVDPHL